ncbi:DUF1433 domain-containing protein [Enterococcus faecalis]
MKIKKKILLSLLMIILGVIGLNYYNYNNYLNKQKERIELFFKYNYNNIDSLTFTKVDKTPMGALVFYGYFNKDKNNNFSADIMPYQEEFDGNISIDGKFDDLNFKFGDKNIVSVSEILKIQKKKINQKITLLTPALGFQRLPSLPG